MASQKAQPFSALVEAMLSTSSSPRAKKGF